MLFVLPHVAPDLLKLFYDVCNQTNNLHQFLIPNIWDVVMGATATHHAVEVS